jgi:nicotinate-nucleotide pyrophosphorylase (carboxylating)
MDRRHFVRLIGEILREDVGPRDVTTAFTPNRRVHARIFADADGVVCGLEELRVLFDHHGIRVRGALKEGSAVRRGQSVMAIEGMSRDILPVERTALNLLSRMSAVATLTRKYAARLKALRSRAKIVATRKTTPLLRYFEKKAVVVGGGLPHRMGLYDMILIKDNHLMLFGGDVRAAVEKARSSRPRGMKIEVEVETAADALIAAESGANIIMFDNMQPREIAFAIEVLKRRRLRARLTLEVSGGVSLERLGRFAKLDVDWISTGKLTHSAPNVDFRMEMVK